MAQFRHSIGFIGSGNMARAIIRGMLNVSLVSSDNVWISDANPEQVTRLTAECGVNAAADNRDLARKADVIVIATKPHHVGGVVTEVRDLLDPKRHLLVSICAGVKTTAIEIAAGEGIRVARVMPNTPALIGCGSAAISGGKATDDEDLALVSLIFNSVGKSVIVPEDKLDAVTGLSGSGPAYVFRFMEALLAAGVEQGLTEAEAKTLVPQMVLGAARMAVEGDRSLAEMREAVTTPGGTTAAGLHVLEEGDFMQLIHDCVEAATVRSRELASGK